MEQSAGASGSSENSSGSDEGGAVDYGEILQSHEQAFKQQSKTVDQLRRSLDQSTETMGRVKRAFAGDDPPEQNPLEAAIKGHEELMDYFLQQGLEAERQGRAIPLTVTLGTKLAQQGIEAEKRYAKLEAKFEKLNRSVQRQEDPNFQLTDRAAAAMEGMLQDGLSQVYGGDPSSERTRNAQFAAVAGRITEEIQDLQKNDPGTWDKIRRNPAAMRKMVNYFVQDQLPPRVREMLENQRVQDTVMTTRELHSAFAQANDARLNTENEREAEQYSNIMDSIRQEIIARQYGKGRRNENPSLNELLRA